MYEYKVRTRSGENFGQALARELDGFIRTNAYRLDGRTKEGKKAEEIKEAIQLIDMYMRRTEGMQRPFFKTEGTE